MAMDIVNNRSKGLAAKDPHALAVAEAFTELSAIYEQLNQPEEAIGLLKRALTVFAEIPEQKNAAAGTQAQVGLLLINNGQLEAALPHLEDAVEKLRQSFGDNHFSLGLVLNHLGVAHLELGHPVKALKILEEAKKILSKAYGPSNSDTLGSYENLVYVYSKLGRYAHSISPLVCYFGSCYSEIKSCVDDLYLVMMKCFETGMRRQLHVQDTLLVN
jgi:tetratricopeptide (TPR) repeat protein